MIVQINNIAKSFNILLTTTRTATARRCRTSGRRKRPLTSGADAAGGGCNVVVPADKLEEKEGSEKSAILSFSFVFCPSMLLADFKLSLPCLDFYLPKTFPSPPITHTHFFVKFEAHFFKINHYVKLFKDENII